MKSIGIYHQIDLTVLDAAATLRAQGKPGAETAKELAGLAVRIGISPKTAEKRMRPAKTAWLASDSAIIERAVEIMANADKADRLALHTAALFRAYPFFFDVVTHVGTAQRLGATVRQSTIRDRVTRSYGHTGSVHQGVQKTLQTLVSWGVLNKTHEPGVYLAPPPQPIGPAAAEVLLASILSATERDALPMTHLEGHPATYPFRLPPAAARPGRLLRVFAEGTGLLVQVQG